MTSPPAHHARDTNDRPRAIALALADAKITAADVGMIVAHGNGTPASDTSEAKGILRAFGGNPPPVTAFKWCVGHLFAAALSSARSPAPYVSRTACADGIDAG